MPATYVKPHVDATDAEATFEAVTRATMRFVETKMPEQQSYLMLHGTRHLLIRRQTAVINAIRAHLAEPLGRLRVEELFGVVADSKNERVPDIARACLAALGAQPRVLKKPILESFTIMLNCAPQHILE
jgi:transposase